MKFVKNYPVCKGCVHSKLHYCAKYDELCPSVRLDGDRYQLICLECSKEDGYEFGVNLQKPYTGLIACMHMPGPENLDIYRSLSDMRKYYPEAFYENRRMTEIYGAFAGAIWNGRTPDYGGYVLSIEQIHEIREEIESLGLTCNLTWNNHLVAGTDVYDRFCNNITEAFHNGKHSITVASMELYNYLKEKYPNFTYYQSVITTTNDSVFTKKADDFDMYLMNRNLNNNWEELLKVPEEERGKIEFLCNDACTPICQRMGHYNVVNKCLLNRCNDCIGTYCTIDHDFMNYNAKTWPMTIRTDHIDEYLSHGFQHFKLCSRGDIKPILAIKMIEYLVKPEYVLDAFVWVMHDKEVPEELLKQK